MSRNVSRKTALSAALLASACLALSACAIDDATGTPAGTSTSTDTATGTEPAELSGELVVACGNQEDVCQAWVQAFEAATGVKTSYVRLASGEAVARLEAGKTNPEFDVWHGGPVDGYNVAAEAGLLAQYESPVAEEIPAEYMDPNGYWGGVYVASSGSAPTRRCWTN